MSGFKIGSRQVGDGAPALIVAEVGLAHDGSLVAAHSYIDAVAEAGADAVKFQCHTGDPVSEWRIPPPLWWPDKTRQDYWHRTAFSPQEWAKLAEHVKDAGLIFLCSPFSVEAVWMLDPFMPAWKLPSGLVHPGPVLDAVQKINLEGKPVIVSHGMSSWEDVIWSTGFYPVALLQCTSLYPTPAEKIGLSELTRWREYFGCPIGLSDHSGTIYPSLAAAALGADILEVHVCFSKAQWGFDVESSITIDWLAQLVEGVRFIEKARQPVDKDALTAGLKQMRQLFMGANA